MKEIEIEEKNEISILTDNFHSLVLMEILDCIVYMMMKMIIILDNWK